MGSKIQVLSANLNEFLESFIGKLDHFSVLFPNKVKHSGIEKKANEEKLERDEHDKIVALILKEAINPLKSAMELVNSRNNRK